MRSFNKVGVAAAVAVFFLAFAARAEGAPVSLQFPKRTVPSPTPPQPPAPPTWADEKIAVVDFDRSGNQRRGRYERREYQVNPEGAIYGVDLLRLTQLAPKAEFLKFYVNGKDGPSPARQDWTASYLASGKAGDPVGEYYNEAESRAAANAAFDALTADEVDALARGAWSKYSSRNLERAAAQLALIRIIDNEAMKLKLSPKALEDRVDFVVRWAVLRNAVATGVDCEKERGTRAPGWLPDGLCVREETARNFCGNRYRDLDGSWLTEFVPTQDTRDLSTDALYDGLVKRVGKERVTFTIDWQYQAGELGQALQALQKKEPAGFPNVDLVFNRLPGQPIAECVPELGQSPYVACALESPKPLQCEEGFELRVDNGPNARLAYCVSKANGARAATVLQCKKPPAGDPDSILGETVRLVTPREQFRDQVAKKLEAVQRKQIRKVAWDTLVSREFPMVAWESLLAASEQEIAAHQLLAGEARVADRSVLMAELQLSGASAPKAAKRVDAIVAERQAKALEGLFARNPGDSPITDAEQQEVTRKVKALREALPQELLAQLKQEFASDLGSGNLSLTMRNRKLKRKGSIATLPECAWKPALEFEGCKASDRESELRARGGLEPWMKTQAESAFYSASSQWEKLDPCSSEAEIARLYFGQFAEFENQAVFPVRQFAEGTDLPQGVIRVTLLKEIQNAEPVVLQDLERTAQDQKADPKVRADASRRATVLRKELDQAIRTQVQVKNQGWLFRDLAFRLFQRNRVEVLVDTASDARFEFPSMRVEPKAMAEALFPEQLFEERTLAEVFYPDDYKFVSSDGGFSRRKRTVARFVREYLPVRASEGDLPGRETVRSTLEAPRLQMRVRMIDLGNFSMAMALPNPGVKPKPCPKAPAP